MEKSDKQIIENVKKGVLNEAEMYEILHQRVDGLELVNDDMASGGYLQFVFRESGTDSPMYGILYTLTQTGLVEEMIFQGAVHPAVKVEIATCYIPVKEPEHGFISIDKHIAGREDLGAQFVNLLKDVDFSF